MSHTTLPTVMELQALLFSAGILSAPPSNTQDQLFLDEAIGGAAAEWGRVTGYQPFVADTSDVTRYFEPPGPTIRGTRYGYRARGGERYVDLQGGLVSLTSVTTGVDASSAGSLRTLNTDFYLYPRNAPAENRPYTRLEFVLPVWGAQQSVVVVGKWGWSATVPDDAWQAMLFMAALSVVPALETGTFGGIVKWTDADTSEQYNAKPYGALAEQWTTQINRAMNNYLRL